MTNNITKLKRNLFAQSALPAFHLRRCALLGALFLGEIFLFPILLSVPGGGQEALPVPSSQPEETTAAEPSAALEEAPAETTALLKDQQASIQVQLDGQVVDSTLHDYLWGVVAAEMPASFEPEALRAQAIAARTETLYRAANPSPNHPDADICTDYTCCQAYISWEDAMSKWGDSAEEYAARITQAVESTDGLVVTYEGQVIQALFHSSSAGHTLSAAEVWGGDLPYLTGVDSPEGEEVPNYYSVVTFTPEDFQQTLLAAYPSVRLEGTPDTWDIQLIYNDNGNLAQVELGGVSLKATEVRTLFGLRSACFTVEATQDAVTFYVTGYGHGVGMSQYGANELAKEGYSATDILQWYYTGAEVTEYQG